MSVQMVLKVCFSFFACAAVCVCEPCAAVGTEVAAMERSTMENGSASNR